MFFILFPSGTDVPLYQPPYGTVGLIAFNIIVYALQVFFPGGADWFLLHHGSFNPITWLTSCCMHGGVWHLLGNMMGLAVFGWIIEGRIGWWRMLLLFFAIGAIQCAFEQSIFLVFGSAGGYTLGASSAIFGLTAVAMLWAPENNLSITYAGLIFFWPIFGTFEVSVAAFCFVVIAIEFLIAWFTFFALSSAVLHLMGVVPGFALGFLLIKYRRVDCEGYDLISIWQGKKGERVKTIAAEQKEKEQALHARRVRQSEVQVGLRKVEDYINSGHFDMALSRFQMLRNKDRTLVMTERQLLTVIKAFDRNDATKEKIIPIIQTYLTQYTTHRVSLTLMQAKAHLLLQERPRQTLKTLKNIQHDDLTLKQGKLFEQLVIRAKDMIDRGVLEVDE